MIYQADNSNIEKAAACLRAGGLVSFPTETVYGLGANALSKDAVDKIFKVKNRPASNPLIVHIYSTNQIEKLISTSIPLVALERLRKLYSLWPGPLSVVLPAADIIPPNVSAGTSTIAIRIPSHPVALKLLECCNLPIAAPSANPSGYVSPTTAQHVESNLGSRVDMILDGGPCSIGIESTVISLTQDKPIILRPGFVTREQLQKHLREEIEVFHAEYNSAQEIISPGMGREHYAPHTPLIFSDQADNIVTAQKKAGGIFFKKNCNRTNRYYEKIVYLSEQENHNEIAEKLFAAIREMDNLGLDYIVIDRTNDDGVGSAIMDRLQRATFGADLT